MFRQRRQSCSVNILFTGKRGFLKPLFLFTILLMRRISMRMKQKGVVIAAVVASLFATTSYAENTTTTTTTTAPDPTVHCMGVNSCRGTSACKTTMNNSCKGMNACKGRGVVNNLTAKQCAEKGGKLLDNDGKVLDKNGKPIE
jgi:hypothetical protein